MSFWSNLTQQINTFVDSTKSAIATATAAATAALPEESIMIDPSVKINEVEIGTVLVTQSLDAELFPSFAIVLDSLSGQTTIGEKRFVGVSERQVFELSPSHRGTGLYTVADAHPLDALAKLRFRKADEKKSGLLMLELKSGTVLKYVLRDPLPCVEAVRRQMAALGIAGNVTRAAGNSTRFVDIKNAQELFQRATEIADTFTNNANIDLVKEMMDVLRVSTEKFSAANDGQFADVQKFAKEFLSRSDVLSLLDQQKPLRDYHNNNSKSEKKSLHHTEDLLGLENQTASSSENFNVNSLGYCSNDLMGLERTKDTTSPPEKVSSPTVSPLPAESLQLLVSPSLSLPSDVAIGNISHIQQQMQRALTFSSDEVDLEDTEYLEVSNHHSSNFNRNGANDVVSSGEDLADDLHHLLKHLDDELRHILHDDVHTNTKSCTAVDTVYKELLSVVCKEGINYINPNLETTVVESNIL